MITMLEQQILETYDLMIECIKRDDLDNASKLQQVINELKQQLQAIR